MNDDCHCRFLNFWICTVRNSESRTYVITGLTHCTTKISRDALLHLEKSKQRIEIFRHQLYKLCLCDLSKGYQACLPCNVTIICFEPKKIGTSLLTRIVESFSALFTDMIRRLHTEVHAIGDKQINKNVFL